MKKNRDKKLIQYYADRAIEYEKTYQRPERQKDIASIHSILKKLFKGHNVLEIACGTGYWTETIASVANLVTATDINQEVLQIARNKKYTSNNVTFIQDDSLSINKIKGKFSAGFSGFWWSHILKSKLKTFLNIFHSKLQSDALVVFIDNLYTKNSSTPISRIDNEGNTYQIRTLEDGRKYEIVKNFPKKNEFAPILGDNIKNLNVKLLTYFWITSYNII